MNGKGIDEQDGIGGDQAEDGQRAEILGVFSRLRDFRRNPIDDFLDRRIDRLDGDQQEKQDGGGQADLSGDVDNRVDRRQSDARRGLVPKGSFPCQTHETAKRIACGRPEMGKTGLLGWRGSHMIGHEDTPSRQEAKMSRAGS